MMALNLRDLFKRATPEERAEIAREVVDLPAIVAKVREELANPTTQPERPVMDPAERASLGREYRARSTALLAARENHATRIADLETRRAAIAAELADAYAQGPDERAFTSWRDAAWRRLWDERPALVDELIAQVLAEADALQIEWRDIPGAPLRPSALFDMRVLGEIVRDDDPIDRSGLPRRVANAVSVQARQAALRKLASDVRRWTERGEYGSEAELRERFEAAYLALPAVESIDDTLRRNPRGTRYAKPAHAPLSPVA